MNVIDLRDKVLSGCDATREEALAASRADLDELCRCADEIRARFCGDRFDLCAIVNGKSGRCTENCRFCAQSAHYKTSIHEYGLLSIDEFVSSAKRAEERGVLRFSIVTSGRRPSSSDLDMICAAIAAIRDSTSLAVCCSLGLLTEAEFRRVRESGATRAHNNLETSRRFFPTLCTTHSYDEKLSSLRAARAAGLSLCSGGIFGVGESFEDRVDMALTLRELAVDSVPINIYTPIAGAPLANLPVLTSEDARRIVAVYRFLLPRASIRLAGGRGLLSDQGASCFMSGANATITGDMLTTSGVDAAYDIKLVKSMGYRPQLDSELQAQS